MLGGHVYFIANFRNDLISATHRFGENVSGQILSLLNFTQAT